MAKLETEIADLGLKILNEVHETSDRFIFQTILAWKQGESSISQIEISKKILNRALICFKNEHPEEYEELLKEI